MSFLGRIWKSLAGDVDLGPPALRTIVIPPEYIRVEVGGRWYAMLGVEVPPPYLGIPKEEGVEGK